MGSSQIKKKYKMKYIMSTNNQKFFFLLSIIIIIYLSSKINAFSLIAQQNSKLICGYYCNQIKINGVTKIPKFVNRFPELCTKWKDCDDYFSEFVEKTTSTTSEVTTSKIYNENEKNTTTFLNLSVNQQEEKEET